MQIEFNNQLLPQNIIDIDQIGDFGLEASNDDGYYFYMAVRCFQGIAIIGTCGPIIPDLPNLPVGFTMNLNKVPFQEDKLSRLVDIFLNDKHRKITEATLLSFEDAVDQFRELKDYLSNLSEETF